MIQNEVTVKGIILAVYSQGEYGKRISLLSDKYGEITVFAQGAAKQNSKIIGACRPFVCAEFTLAVGKNAWNLHGINVIESFEEIPLDPDIVFTGSYILEFASYFSGEGMTQEDAKGMLNLIFVTLKALQKKPSDNKTLPPELVRRIFELRMLVYEGVYTEMPCEKDEICSALWEYTIRTSLSGLFDPEIWGRIMTKDGKLAKTAETYIYSVKHLKNTQVDHKFKSEELLQG